jgi:hypothetical protein
LTLILLGAKLFNGVNLFLCQKELINQTKNEPKRNMALEQECRQKMAEMLLKGEKLKVEKN